MRAVADFLSGEQHKLLRHMCALTVSTALLASGAAYLLDRTVGRIQQAAGTQQPLPQRAATTGNGQPTLITRSVLDEPTTTGSIGQRPIQRPVAPSAQQR